MGLDEATHLVVAPDGDIVVGGPFYDTFRWGADALTALDGPDVFVLRLDADGTPRWARRLAPMTSGRPRHAKFHLVHP